MLYVLVELNGLRQLSLAEKVISEKVISDMKSFFTEDIFNLQSEKNGLFIYGCNPDEKDAFSVFEICVSVLNYLKSESEALYGFNLLVSQTESSVPGKQESAPAQKVNSLQTDEALYIDENLFDLFGDFGDFLHEGIFYRLVSYRETERNKEENLLVFLKETPEFKQFMEGLSPFINDETKGVLFVYGEYADLSFLAYCSSAVLEGQNGISAPWLYIAPDDGVTSDSNPLVASMDKGFIQDVQDYLDSWEKDLWESKKWLVDNVESIVFDEDALIIFRLYLKAYSRMMHDNFLPAVVFLSDLHLYSSQTVFYLASVLEDLYQELDLLPVLFSADNDLPAAFAGIPAKKIEIEQPGETDKDKDKFLVSRYYRYFLENQGLESGTESEAVKEVLNYLGASARYFYRIYILLYDLCGRENLIKLMSENKSDEIRFEKLFSELVSSGYIFPGGRFRPVHSQLENLGLPSLTHDSEKQIFNIIDTVATERQVRSRTVYEKSVRTLFRMDENYRGILYLLRDIELLIENGKTSDAGVIFEKVSGYLRKSAEKYSDHETRQTISFLKAAVFDNKDGFASDVYLRLCGMESADTVLDAERRMACSDYLYAVYKYKKGLDESKKALMDIQDSGNNILLTDINLSMSMILMGLQRMDESMDYFRNARETADICGDVYRIIRVKCSQAVISFVAGNFSESLRIIEDVQNSCDLYGRRDWQLFLKLLHGRLLFEFGEYDEAMMVFSDGLRLCDVYFGGRRKDLFNIWIGRCFCYLGQHRDALRIFSDFENIPEALYYGAEACYFQEEYRDAYDLIERAYLKERDRIRLFASTNIISWESSYDFIEDRCFVSEGSHGVLFQLIRAFRAYIMTRMGYNEEGTAELVRLTREDRLSDKDLNNGFYYYLHALTLPENTGSEAVDRITLLSRALRHVQQTASNIDKPAHRQKYLFSNYWNSGLMKEGRAHKLI